MRAGIVRSIRSAWINLGVALVVLALLEGVFQVVFTTRDRGRPAFGLIVPEERLRAAYPGQPWVHDYYRELLAVQATDWHPYVYWRSRPYRGQFINIGEHGIRRTWNASPAPGARQPKMFIFGGSTMWGYAARDDFTIASYVSKKLASSLGSPPWVVNFGESGYVTTQEVLALVLELRKGNVPDIVVFYDGVNEAWAAFQSNVAGIPQNEINRVVEFNLREQLNWRRGFVEKLGLYRVARGVTGSLGGAEAGPVARGRYLDPSLAAAVTDVYLWNVRFVNLLAREYGFRAVFYWQPTVYSKKVLSPDEDRWRLTAARMGSRRPAPIFADEHKAFNQVFQQKMKTAGIDNLYDLSELFANDKRTIFVDRFHISEVGNEKVADAMIQTLQNIVPNIKK